MTDAKTAAGPATAETVNGPREFERLGAAARQNN